MKQLVPVVETGKNMTVIKKVSSLDPLSRGNSRRPQKVTDFIAGQIRKKIIDGELNEGDMLPPQNQLLEEFGVSRPTLREAFRILEAERLITTVRGARGGAFINAPDPDLIRAYTILVWQSQKTTVGDIFSVRRLIEPPVVRELALNTSDEIVNALQASLDAEKMCKHEPRQFAKAVAGFHRVLLKQFGNHPLSQFMETVDDVLEAHIPVLMLKSAEKIPSAEGVQIMEQSFLLKQMLIDLIAKGDAEGAEMNWRRYMDVSYANWMAVHVNQTVLSLLSA